MKLEFVDQLVENIKRDMDLLEKVNPFNKPKEVKEDEQEWIEL